MELLNLIIFTLFSGVTDASCYYTFSYIYSNYIKYCYSSYYYNYYYYYYYSYTSDVGVIAGAVVGGIIGFIILVSIIVVICIAVCKKSSGMRGTVIRPSQPAVSVVTAPNQQISTGYHYPQQPVVTPYPPQYTPSATNNAYPPPPPPYSYN